MWPVKSRSEFFSVDKESKELISDTRSMKNSYENFEYYVLNFIKIINHNNIAVIIITTQQHVNNYERGEVKEPAAHEVVALTIITSSFQNPPVGTQKEKASKRSASEL